MSHDDINVTRLRVLTVSPLPGERALLGTMLRNIGVRRIEDANTSAAAFLGLRGSNYNIAVIDEKLDGGFESFAESLRRCSRMGINLPALILMAERPTISFVHRAVQSGYATVLARPFAARDLERHFSYAMSRLDAYGRQQMPPPRPRPVAEEKAPEAEDCYLL